MRTELFTWRSNLYAALGLATVACSGQIGRTGDNGTGGAGGRNGVEFGCVDPTPVLSPDGEETGFVSCSAGFLHRTERRECGSSLPRPGPLTIPPDTNVGCTRDADCTDRPHGYCSLHPASIGLASTYCNYGCVRDEDCSGGNVVCVCGNPVGNCVSATCTTNADCGAGFACASSVKQNPCGGAYQDQFTCQRANDKCRGQADCPSPGETCNLLDSGRACGSSGACGRPFLVGGAPRLASVSTRRSGWSAELAAPPSVAALDPVARSELIAYWTRNGLMEHASVAAFARFTLELLALGAPASLVQGAQRALGDEIAHAELCFALARSYAGQALEPGPLPLEGALTELSFFEIVSTAIAEACIGETLAAVEAAEAREHAADPQVRAVLERIAADEARHAELGWKFLRWALAKASAHQRQQLRRFTARLVDAERAHTHHAGSIPSSPDLRAHGVLTPRLRAEVYRTTLEELIAPLVSALFDAPLSAARAASS